MDIPQVLKKISGRKVFRTKLQAEKFAIQYMFQRIMHVTYSILHRIYNPRQLVRYLFSLQLTFAHHDGRHSNMYVCTLNTM